MNAFLKLYLPVGAMSALMLVSAHWIGVVAADWSKPRPEKITVTMKEWKASTDVEEWREIGTIQGRLASICFRDNGTVWLAQEEIGWTPLNDKARETQAK